MGRGYIHGIRIIWCVRQAFWWGCQLSNGLPRSLLIPWEYICYSIMHINCAISRKNEITSYLSQLCIYLTKKFLSQLDQCNHVRMQTLSMAERCSTSSISRRHKPRKLVYYKNFFNFHPILMKLSEIGVLMSTTISPNFIKIGAKLTKFL